LVMLLFVVHLRSGPYDRPRTILQVVILAAALLAKESAVVAPVLIALLDVLVLRPGAGKPDEEPGGVFGPAMRRRAIRVWLPLLVTVGAYVALRQWRLGLHAPAEPFGHLESWWGGSWLAQLVVAGRGFLLQCGAVLFPMGSRLDVYPPTHGRLDAGALLAFLAVASILVVAWRLRRHRPLVSFGLLWFLVAMLPTANVAFTVGILSADRFLYLPLAGLVLVVAPILARCRLATVGLLAVYALLSVVAS
ncbi:MAG: hypothetical protein GY704_07585, partial [Phycisphaeraceae bacterium]|nr:hypothetical protein [Phycisphaeraceae bacterium]